MGLLDRNGKEGYKVTNLNYELQTKIENKVYYTRDDLGVKIQVTTLNKDDVADVIVEMKNTGVFNDDLISTEDSKSFALDVLDVISENKGEELWNNLRSLIEDKIIEEQGQEYLNEFSDRDIERFTYLEMEKYLNDTFENIQKSMPKSGNRASRRTKGKN